MLQAIYKIYPVRILCEYTNDLVSEIAKELLYWLQQRPYCTEGSWSSLHYEWDNDLHSMLH